MIVTLVRLSLMNAKTLLQDADNFKAPPGLSSSQSLSTLPRALHDSGSCVGQLLPFQSEISSTATNACRASLSSREAVPHPTDGHIWRQHSICLGLLVGCRPYYVARRSRLIWLCLKNVGLLGASRQAPRCTVARATPWAVGRWSHGLQGTG